MKSAREPAYVSTLQRATHAVRITVELLRREMLVRIRNWS